MRKEAQRLQTGARRRHCLLPVERNHNLAPGSATITPPSPETIRSHSSVDLCVSPARSHHKRYMAPPVSSALARQWCNITTITNAHLCRHSILESSTVL